MGDHEMKKTRERLEDEFKQVSSVEKWTKDSLENMKNILKAMYYIDVICAMKEGEEYPGSEYMGSSYARGGNRMNGGYRRGGSGTYPMNDGYGYRIGGYGMSGRPYYDDEKDHAVHKLRGIMDTTNNDEVRMAVQSVLNELSR